ncbi:hypothetical protein ACHAXN_012567 [Cyclotella atomus]
MVLFLSKCNNLNNYLQKTVLRCFINFSDYHKVHRLFGIIVGIESASHSFFHLFRWKCRSDDIKLLYTSQTGITGLIALTYISQHSLIDSTFQRPPLSLNRMGYGLDVSRPSTYILDDWCSSLWIESAHFERLSDTCCIISFENPPGFGKRNSA